MSDCPGIRGTRVRNTAPRGTEAPRTDLNSTSASTGVSEKFLKLQEKKAVIKISFSNYFLQTYVPFHLSNSVLIIEIYKEPLSVE